LSPRRLLTGKVLGVGLLGLAEVIVVGSAGLAAGAIAGGAGLPSGAPATVALVVGWFALGFATALEISATVLLVLAGARVYERAILRIVRRSASAPCCSPPPTLRQANTAKAVRMKIAASECRRRSPSGRDQAAPAVAALAPV
jgi:hypothetical protein